MRAAILIAALTLVQTQITPENFEDEDGFFEGDMKLNAEQLALLAESLITDTADQSIETSDDMGPSNNAVIGSRYRWPSNTVRYQLHNYLNANEKNLVRTTLNNLQSKMDNCVRFVESSSGNRIVVKNNLGGCFSSVGYQGKSTQDLSIGRRGCMSVGIIEHEFLHAIGLYHHQSRSDRDSYVRIIWNNIPKDKRHNFNKYNTNMVKHYDIPYDYRSIMHYGGKDFGNGRMTIQTLDSSKQNVIGQRKGVSAGDVELVKRMYNCRANPVTPTATPYVCKEDVHDICPDFKAAGHCTSGNAKVNAWMKANCYKSCVGCLGGQCPYTDNKNDCPGWASLGYCVQGQEYAGFMEKNCAKSCKCPGGYNCQEVGVNYQDRVRATVMTDVSSWEGCRQLCADRSSCTAWVWNNSGAGVYKHRCAVMAGYGKKAADVNTVAGPKNCA